MVFLFFNHRELTPYLTRQGAGRYKLTKKSLEKILIPLPPITEQRAITHILGRLDAAINCTGRLIVKKELRKKWLMQNLLTGKQRLKGFSVEWQEYHLGEMFAERNERNIDELPLLSIGQNGVYPQGDSIKKTPPMQISQSTKKYALVISATILCECGKDVAHFQPWKEL